MGETTAGFVCLTIVDLAPSDFDRVSQQTAHTAQTRAPLVPGFIEAAVLGSEDKTRLLIFSHWTTRDAWAVAQWDDELGRAVADLAKSATSYDVRSFVPIAIIRPGT